VETSDQLRAIEDVKADMERPLPMDRLVCGDVGFGKTEVAIRAVFKAVQEGTQAAVLVPTTLLASQHFQTFTERYAPFPVRVELLSRFLTNAQAKKVVDGLADGSACWWWTRSSASGSPTRRRSRPCPTGWTCSP
jgi:transcription-repair coupling factor (superfamily II helicase)